MDTFQPGNRPTQQPLYFDCMIREPYNSPNGTGRFINFSAFSKERLASRAGRFCVTLMSRTGRALDIPHGTRTLKKKAVLFTARPGLSSYEL